MNQESKLTPDSILAAIQSKKKAETAKAAEIAWFLKRQNGVIDAEVHQASGGGALKAAVWFTDTPSGLPKGKLSDGTLITELKRYETEYLYQEIFVDRVYVPPGLSLEPGALVLDVGANIGIFSLFISRLVPSARIVSFEPSPDAYAALSANVNDHALPVTCLPWAIGKKTEPGTMTVYPAASVFSGLHAVASVDRSAIQAAIDAAVDDPSSAATTETLAATRMEGAHEVGIDIWSLPDIMTTLGADRIDLLKLDAEGSELGIFEQLGPSDWAKIDQVVMEIHSHSDAKTLVDLFSRAGFDYKLDSVGALRGTGFINLYAQRRNRSPRTAGSSAYRALPTVPPLSPAKRLRQALDSFLGDRALTVEIEVKIGVPTQTDGTETRKATAVQSTVVESIVSVWREMLARHVSPTDNFFLAGGTSVMAIRMLSRIHSDLGWNVRFEEFMANPSPEGLAAHFSVSTESQLKGSTR